MGADMHAGARQLCKELLANIDFILVKYQAEDGQAEPLDEQTIKDIKTKLDQVQSSCSSAIPDKISEAFKTVNSLIMFDLGIKGLDQCTRIEVQCVRISNIFLSNEIAKTWMWPARLPPLTVCKTVRQELKREVLDPQFEAMQNKVKEWKEEEDQKQAKKEVAANEAAKKEAAAKEAAKKEAAAKTEAAKKEAAKKEAAKKEAVKKEALAMV